MKALGFFRYALTSCVAAAMLAGCGGSQPPIGAPATMPLATRRPVRPPNASLLYVLNTSCCVKYPIDIFLRDDASKGIVGHIGRFLAEGGIFVDSHGTLYTTTGWESGENSARAYKRGAHKPFRIYSGADCAFDIAAASDGTVYIADACGTTDFSTGDVAVYRAGQTKPSRLIDPGGAPYALALDAHDNLYVGYNSLHTYWGQVKRYRPGAQRGEALLPSNFAFFITGVGIDKSGALLVANNGSGAIDVFTNKRRPPSRVIHTGQSHIDKFAFDAQGDALYVTSGCISGGAYVPRPSSSSGCGKRPNELVALDYATGKRLWTLQRIGIPVSVAVWPRPTF
jgi:hypothetical protein